MIAQLKGIISHKSPEGIIVDVQGVGYEVIVSKRTLDYLAEPGESVVFLIYTHLTENALSLFGFLKSDEKTAFKKLMSVSGVGPRLALQILSGMSVPELAQALVQENLLALTSISGVGKKTAERLIVELKDKMIEFLENTPLESSGLSLQKEGGGILQYTSTLYQEALSALTNLGYHRNQADRILSKISLNETSSIEEILKKALGELGG